MRSTSVLPRLATASEENIAGYQSSGMSTERRFGTNAPQNSPHPSGEAEAIRIIRGRREAAATWICNHETCMSHHCGCSNWQARQHLRPRGQKMLSR